MKCTNCSNEMRVVPEAIGIDSSGNPVYHRMAYCDSCKTKIDIDINTPSSPTKKGESICGIIGMILSFIFCNILFPVIGLILCIIGLRSKEKKSVCGKIGLVVSIMAIIINIMAPEYMKYVNEERENSSVSQETNNTGEEKEENDGIEQMEMKDQESSEPRQEEVSKPESIEITFDEIKQQAQELDYKAVMRNPENYAGQYFAVTVKILTVENGSFFSSYDRAYKAYTNDEYGLWFGNMIYLLDNRDTNSQYYTKILEDDILTVYGRFDKLVETKNALNGAKGEEMSLQILYTEFAEDGTEESTVSNEPDNSADSFATMGQKNALKSAQNYLTIMAFSYNGIIEQLEYEEYSHEDAVYAADNCGADWNEQAAKCAKNYLDIMAFSKSGLIEQLESEGFTHEQAVYGAEQNGY